MMSLRRRTRKHRFDLLSFSVRLRSLNFILSFNSTVKQQYLDQISSEFQNSTRVGIPGSGAIRSICSEAKITTKKFDLRTHGIPNLYISTSDYIGLIAPYFLVLHVQEF